MKRLKFIIIFSAIIVLLTGCIQDNLSRLMVFFSIKEDVCDVIELSETSGKPMSEVQISNISESFGDQLALEVVDAKDKSSKLYSPVLRLDENNGVFHVPVHPSGKIKGGKVSITLKGEDEGSCELPIFTITAMEESPGAYEELVKLTDEVNKEQRRVLTGDESPSLHGQSGEAPVTDLPFDIVEGVIRGEDNENSLEKIIEGKAPDTKDLTKEQSALIDSLVKESKILDALEKYHQELKSMETFYDESNSNTSNPSVNQDKSLFCDLGIHRPSAKTLSRMMELQRFGEGIASYHDVMSGASTLLGAGVIVTTSTGILAPAAPFLAKLGLSIYAIQTISGIMDGILPHDFVDIKSNFHPGNFKEDDENLTGVWKETMVTAQSKGFNIGEAVLSGLLQLAGTKGMGGLNMKWLSRFNDGKAVSKGLTTAASKTMSSYVSTIIKEATNGADFVQIPPCDFGPTDITSIEWSESAIQNNGESPVEIIDHNQNSGHYRANDIGSATLTIVPRKEHFAGKSITEYQEVGVLPIEVKVDPPSYHGEPGDVVIYTAEVANANDKSVKWEIEPQGAHTFTTSINRNGDSYIMIQSSTDSEDYPVVVRAISTSNQGLRSLPDAPPRFGEALLGGTYTDIIVTPGVACVQPGKTQTFEAAVYGTSNEEVVWSTDGGSISKEGLYKAPKNKGEYKVTATGVVDKKAIGTATITVGDCLCTNNYSLIQDGIGTGVELFYASNEDFKQGRVTSRDINLTSLNIKSSNFQSRIIREDAFKTKNEKDYKNKKYGLLDGELAGLFFGSSLSDANRKDTPVTFIDFQANSRPQLGNTGTFNAVISGSLLTDDHISYEMSDQPVTVKIDKFENLAEPHEAIVKGKVEGLIEVGYSKGDYLNMHKNIASTYVYSEELNMQLTINFEGHFVNPLPVEIRMDLIRRDDMSYEEGLTEPSKRASRMIACDDEKK